jgi:hypothetical protein
VRNARFGRIAPQVCGSYLGSCQWDLPGALTVIMFLALVCCCGSDARLHWQSCQTGLHGRQALRHLIYAQHAFVVLPKGLALWWEQVVLLEGHTRGGPS